MGLSKDKLPVLEQFVSVQGEGKNLGTPYYFIRVGGCPLRCRYCDSEYTWKVSPQSIMLTAEVAQRAYDVTQKQGIDWISVTGGEPLLYLEQLKDMMHLWHKESSGKLQVHIETSGRFYDDTVHQMSHLFSMDIKTPCTNEVNPKDLENLKHMRSCDQVKCLIETEADLEHAKMVHDMLDGRCALVLQPFNLNVGVVNPSVDKAYLLLEQYRWLVGHVLNADEPWPDTIITPQVHVLTFGNVPAT